MCDKMGAEQLQYVRVSTGESNNSRDDFWVNPQIDFFFGGLICNKGEFGFHQFRCLFREHRFERDSLIKKRPTPESSVTIFRKKGLTPASKKRTRLTPWCWVCVEIDLISLASGTGHLSASSTASRRSSRSFSRESRNSRSTTRFSEAKCRPVAKLRHISADSISKTEPNLKATFLWASSTCMKHSRRSWAASSTVLTSLSPTATTVLARWCEPNPSIVNRLLASNEDLPIPIAPVSPPTPEIAPSQALAVPETVRRNPRGC